MDFGFTNSDVDLEAARKFIADAVADGWSIEPTYGEHESVERAARLWKDGYQIQAIMRDNSDKPGKWKHEVSVSIWGPDGLAIRAPKVYDFAAISSGLRRCLECGATDVETQRVGFAGRCCKACLPAAQKKHEYPGWTK